MSAADLQARGLSQEESQRLLQAVDAVRQHGLRRKASSVNISLV